MSSQLTAEQREQIRQVSATMAIENMPMTETMHRDAVDYLTGTKSEQEILDGIAARALAKDVAYA